MATGTLFVLYVAGLATFLSPCVLPLLPSYLAVLAGAGANGGRPWKAGLGFALGLSLVFVLLGLGASVFAQSLAAHRQWLMLGAGALMVLFGAKLLGLLPMNWLASEARPLLSRVPSPGGFGGGVLFGAAFSLGWTPCVGPVLGATLSYAASRASSPAWAAVQLAVYALGLSTPLVAATFAADRVVPLAKRMRVAMPWAQRVTGGVLVALGLLLATDRLQVLSEGLPRQIAANCATEDAKACDVAAGALEGEVDEDVSVPQGRPHLVEIVGEHCTVCARMAPVVAELERQCTESDGSIVRVTLESAQGRALARRFNVHALPTFLHLDAEGQEVDRVIGEQTREQLAAAIRSVRGSACS